MSKAIKITPEMIAQMNQKSKDQVVQTGYSPTNDPKFKMFKTPVNEDILVYLPLTNVVKGDNDEEELDLLEVYLHDYKEGTMFSQARCINGLSGGIFTDVLGYDGNCPYCEAVQKAWDLYRVKLEAEAAKIGIKDPQKDKSEGTQALKRRIIEDMDIKGSEEYVVFPVVIIPTEKGGKNIQITGDAFAKDEEGNYSNLEVVFVQWKKKRFVDNILGAVEGMMNGPSHPCGMLWSWKFSYDTKGKQPNARDSALNAKYLPLNDATTMQVVEQNKAALEEVAKEYTNIKATEVIKAIEYKSHDEIEQHAAKVIAKTEGLLEISEVGQIAGAGNALPGNSLANFGNTDAGNAGNVGIEAPAEDGVNFGQ